MLNKFVAWVKHWWSNIYIVEGVATNNEDFVYA